MKTQALLPMSLVILLLAAVALAPLQEARAQDTTQADTTQAAAGAEAATVEVAEQEPYGAFLTDAEGMSLYLFGADEQVGASTCLEDCAEAWPPLLSEGEPTAGEEVDESLLGTIEREDGSQQVTYNGWPLYYFVKDQQPGDTEGQDVEGFGAEWYLVSPQGEAVEAEEGQQEY